MYEVPQLSWVETVDMYAAKNAAVSMPRHPGGRKSRITITYPASLSVNPGYSTSDASPTMIQGQGGTGGDAGADTRDEFERRSGQRCPQPGDSADGRNLEGEPRQRDGAAHREHELKEVGHDDPPQPGQCGVERGDREAGEDGGQPVPPKRDREDLGHGQVHPADDHAIDRQPEVQRAKAAEDGGRPPAVAQLGEFDIGHDAGTPPEPRE